jgi:hypothetical protein
VLAVCAVPRVCICYCECIHSDLYNIYLFDFSVSFHLSLARCLFSGSYSDLWPVRFGCGRGTVRSYVYADFDYYRKHLGNYTLDMLMPMTNCQNHQERSKGNRPKYTLH